MSSVSIINSYIPIIRWRSAEMKAVEKLFSQDRSNVTPLIEFVMPAPSFDKEDKIIKTPKEKIKQALLNVPEDLLNSCGQNTVFIDVHLLDSDIRATSLKQILSTSSLGLFTIPVTYIIPVTSLSTSADIDTREVALNYAKESGHGICIRIDKSHLEEKGLFSYLDDFVKSNKLDIKNTDLLIDLRVITKDIKITELAKQLEGFQNLGEWRSFIVSGGVFPKDLTKSIAGNVYQLERLDWKLWNDLRKIQLPRMPIFSDYTIQCPNYEPINIPGSVSVRYTDNEKWWIFRGTKPGLINKKTQKKGPGREQYIGHAKTLEKRSFYKGVNYSFGDAEITRIASPGNNKTGNPTTWLTIGINHHITLTAHQIANLVGRTEVYSTHAS
ncbi:hypothetical protein A2Y99_00370 [Candidatus Gottesmanbacteria bacterium RBG_13_37_7]|uniref:Beta protein n=1 Tax=Candidatus Gottesmanbacteria bacterium RBG_13_37_7 TaxID=1798369 RepID=A0A1F5YH32_9BACT|nr:MAG: hypothetical protein A2Y99_00370 [Candidatus Gottesmanbacteria bacterium RBG_13_37_7]